MEIRLAENIRALRKQKQLTQEQLAEVLGVTVGAVHKWEAKLSVPELNLIMEMADFFDTSVDVLLGYEMKDNRLAATVQRIKEYRHNKDRSGLIEAEKALKKYPNSFEIVYNCAILYNCFGIESKNKTQLRRALELLENARVLLPQNTDPEIGESTVFGNMAEACLALGDAENAVRLWKQHDTNGMFKSLIGLALASECNRPDEAVRFLEEALLESITSLIRIVSGYMNVFHSQNDYKSFRDIALWGIDVLSGLSDNAKPNFLDKMTSMYFVTLAYAEIRDGNKDEAIRLLRHAKEISENFDASPTYEVNSIRFIAHGEGASVFDDLGATAAEGIRRTIESIADEELSAIWKEMTDNED
ncbi:MAG: helix-turn-helix transcriptional regulator [Clostridium sp.]|nr:helix-turn-helix transcriptional regulator [Clostridium sp.]